MRRFNPLLLPWLLQLAVYLVSEFPTEVVSQWTHLSAKLSRIYTDGDTLVGLTRSLTQPHNVWLADKDFGTRPNFANMPVGACETYLVDKFNVWCVNKEGHIFYNVYQGGSNYFGDGRWDKVEGNVRELASFASESKMYAVNRLNELWYASANIADKPNWKRVGTSVSMVRVGYNNEGVRYILKLDTGGTVFLAEEEGDRQPTWTRIRGSMRSISFDGKMICGIDSDFHVVYSKDKDFQVWRQIESFPDTRGKYTWVACWNDQFWAIEQSAISPDGWVQYLDLKALSNETDSPRCLAHKERCARPARQCCHSCFFANKIRNMNCASAGFAGFKQELFCFRWRCTHHGPGGVTRSEIASMDNYTYTEEEVDWSLYTSAEAAEFRQLALKEAGEFAKYRDANVLPRTGTKAEVGDFMGEPVQTTPAEPRQT